MPILPRLFILVTCLLAVDAVAATYKVDPAHTVAVFRVGHMGVTNVWGRFNEISGTVSFDEVDVSRSHVSLTIQAASIDTNHAKRDQHLRSPDFFNAKQFPILRFESTAVEKIGPDLFRVTGDFAMHGVTKSISMDFRFFGEAQDSSGNTKGGGEASFTLLRSEYGMKYGIPTLSDEIEITVDVEGFKD